ncbi:MAG: hypothetical protein KGJ23_08100 [Euryarchaeota archaeon]|nr:hypothetical protein [Euryarchaeota archaeon]MDE1836563.1 hypothetical protein [Euryarchaeota archaeon]MDE1879242.1 hypothetical protein [Euryarchaeota archaeon]MDE2044533.1 hypothetical protein [Thermoplasmata archaeon]
MPDHAAIHEAVHLLKRHVRVLDEKRDPAASALLEVVLGMDEDTFAAYSEALKTGVLPPRPKRGAVLGAS